MDPVALITEAQAAGLLLEVAGDTLIVRGPKSAEPIVRRLREAKPAVLTLLRSRTQHIALDVETVREVLGDDDDDPHTVACLRFDVLAAVRTLEQEIATGRVTPSVRLVRGRPLADWLTLDVVAALLRAWRDATC